MIERLQLKTPLTERIFSNFGLELCTAAIDIAGRRLTPNEDSAYIEYSIAHAFPVRIAQYGSAFHAGTLGNSFETMQDKVLNRKHNLKANGKREDQVAGTIIGVEFAKPPMGGWKIMNAGNPPYIRAAAVIHKNTEMGKKVLKENVDHKWAVSMENSYQMAESGFLIERDPKKATKENNALMEECSPSDFKENNLGYVPVFLNSQGDLCPAELLDTYDFEKRAITKEWQGQRVTLLKGGINGKIVFNGTGLVRYGAEKEAQVQQILASDPNALFDEDEFEFLPFLAELKSFHEKQNALISEFCSEIGLKK